ncbi:12566_t:CDS:2 [Funneliformis caledonium]|uniref:12566_t:CDS:1 n=1 Tax=Funneliformis caledonium TaxID=1117310 RepID=A0A9N8ZT52_9GLOM|nr:12566_t:CDS:2 [Funneliformis caledonium]
MPEIQSAIAATPNALNGAVEIVNSVVTIGDALNIAKGTLQCIGTAADAITPFIPLIGAATTIISDIIIIYQQAAYNKKIVSALYDRTRYAELAIETLQRRKKLHEKDFRSQEWYDAFNRFVDVLKEIRTFAKEVSCLRGYKKYFKSFTVKERFEALTNSYDVVMKDLNFTMAVANEEQRRYDNECLMDDVSEMSKFLQTIEGGIVTNDNKLNIVLEELRLMKISIDSGKGPIAMAKQIEENEITDPYINEPTDYRGSNRHIIRRQYKTTIEVACKPFELNKDDKEEYKKKQGQLAILSKLSECTNILKFYGLANLNGQNHMILEWAHYGNLREVYEDYDIPWMRKLHIATDICRAITFLQSVDIFHHDLRCENVMLTRNLEPKLTNFEYARSKNASTSSIGDLMKIVHWLAPEKMRDRSTRYNIKCEIFSFGMLLWELTFEKTPYQGWDMERVETHVKAGKREKITFGPVAVDRELEIQKVLEEVITGAWKANPEERISLVKLFNTLEKLQSENKNLMELGCNSNLLPQKSLDLDGSSTPPPPPDSDADAELPEFEDFSLDCGIITVISFEEGVKAHKDGKYDKAWECFEYHADNGNANAKYWMAYYLWEGKFVEKNCEEAAKLFKEAADQGIPDAQLRYAFTFQTKLGKKKYREEFIKYLTLAADGGNQSAQYNLGDVYFNKKLMMGDKQKGIYYLKLAALQNHPNAIKMLEKHNISFADGPKLEN